MNTTQTIIDMVADKAGHPVYNPVGNVALGRILGISHSHVKRLRDGDGTLGRDGFVRACKFLDLQPERIVELALALDADGSEDDGMRAWMRSIAKNLRGTIVKSAGGILLGAAAMLAHVDDAAASGKLVSEAPSPVHSYSPTLYIMVNRMRQVGRWLRGLFSLPPSGGLSPRFA